MQKIVAHQKINCMAFLRWLDPFLPFCVFIGMKFGINYYEIFLLQSVCALAIIFFEMPAGIISDIFGRRVVLMLGSLLFVLAYAVFMVSPSFWSWVIAETIGGAAIACFTGADTAFLYEYTGKKNAENYQKKESDMQFYSRAAEGISVCVGFIALTINERLPIAIALIAKIVMTYVVANLPKEKVRLADGKLTYRQEMKKSIKKMIHDKNKHPERYRLLGKLLLYSSMQSVLSLNMFWMLQVVLDVKKIAPGIIALVWVAYHLLSSMASYYMHLGMRRSVKKLIVSLPVLSILLLLVISQAPSIFMIPSMICFSILWGIKAPLVNCLMNQNSVQSMRATLHSVDSVVTRLVYSVLGPVTGYLVQNTDNNLVFYWLILAITPGLVASLMLSCGAKGLKI